MSAPGFDDAIRSDAAARQKRAAHPGASVFVEANAGSGKTRVLVDRVVNILLEGVAPEEILCVTYTKAAAAEMKDRLFTRLGRWAVADTAALETELKEQLGHGDLPVGKVEAARRLFARALETPGGLKIQTIHAFCENLLRRFPLEAGAPPGFATLDEAEAGRRVEAARQRVLGALDTDTVDLVLRTGGPDAFGNIMGWARGRRHDFRDALDRAGGEAGLIENLYRTLDLEPGTGVARYQGQGLARST